MLQKQEWSMGAESGEIIRPLDEIEAFRNSLVVVKKPAGVRRRSISVSGTFESRLKSDRSKIDLSPPKKARNPSSSSSSSIWNWKPLRALSHIRHRKFDCRFTLQIHSIEGIPSVLDHSRLCVHWRRDGEEIGLSTRSALVSHGAAVFQEILEDRCTVYGSRSSGHRQTAKYQAKPYVLLAAVAGAPGLDLGEHRVDLTRLLPLTLEELEDRSGRWSAAFKLSGQARGALLNVSFGFSLLRGDDFSDLGKNDREISLRRAGSLPIPNRDSRSRLLLPSQSVDEIKVVREIFPASRAAQKYPDHEDECSGDGIPDDCSKINFIALRQLDQSPSVLRTDATLQVAKVDLDEELPDPEFTVIEKGIEFMAKSTNEISDDLGNHEEERRKHPPEEIAGKDEQEEIEKFLNFEFEKSPPDCHSESTTEPDYEELNSLLQNLLIFEPADWESPKSDSKSPEQHNPEEIRSKRTMILDDETEFLRLLGLEHADSSTLSNDSDQESPKARLWKQFREESLADREKNIFDLGMGKHREMNWMDFDCEFDLSATVNVPVKDVLLSQSINSRRRAKQLDDEEAEALMRELGLNEGTFLHTPPGSPTGFGSPIELLPDDHPHVVDDDDDDDHHRFKNSGSMIIQASNPLVMPAGSGVMEILQSLGSLGIEKIASHAKMMMPLEDFPRDRDHGDTCSSELVSLKDLPRMAMEAIEALSIKGLKIQAGTSELKVFDAEIECDDSDGELISLALSPEEWMKLDSGMIEVHDLISERTGKILTAHNGNVEELASGERRRDFLGSKVTLAFMVQLRDDEPVGGPMLALVQAERPPREIKSLDEDGSLSASGFKITDVHLAGVKSETTGRRSLEERSGILASSPLEIDGVAEVCGDGDYLWSISKPGHVTGAFVRNPNISISR